jgi:hypothetical protein
MRYSDLFGIIGLMTSSVGVFSSYLNVHNPTGNTGLVASSEVAFLATVFKTLVIVVTGNVGIRYPSEFASVATVFKRQVVVAVTGNVGLRAPSEVASVATIFKR